MKIQVKGFQPLDIFFRYKRDPQKEGRPMIVTTTAVVNLAEPGANSLNSTKKKTKATKVAPLPPKSLELYKGSVTNHHKDNFSRVQGRRLALLRALRVITKEDRRNIFSALRARGVHI